ncbi:MAG: GNAT family N-acetyltransferase [Roseburia sp.]|nr:GNAT family N-acetyltransferase [Roseburia sp.]
MKSIIWDLPESQITYLKKNCAKHFATGEICAMTQENAAEIYAGINCGEIPATEVLVISANPQILAEAMSEGMITIAYQPSRKSLTDDATANATNVSEPLPQVDMVVEGFEEVHYDFLEKVYQRHHGLPWTILETERLIVRELALSDMDALFELYSYEGMTDYMEGLYPYEEEYRYQKAYIENMYRFFGYGMWLVFEKETKKLVGRAGVEHREELEGELELGYAIGVPWQGKGYATEVCVGILQYVHEELGFEEICSLVRPENAASIRLLKKLGFFREKELILDDICYEKYKKSL